MRERSTTTTTADRGVRQRYRYYSTALFGKHNNAASPREQRKRWKQVKEKPTRRIFQSTRAASQPTFRPRTSTTEYRRTKTRRQADDGGTHTKKGERRQNTGRRQKPVRPRALLLLLLSSLPRCAKKGNERGRKGRGAVVRF